MDKRASILSILEREYVKKDGGRFIPTELGRVVTGLLLENFDDIFDISYTARMQEELDEIEAGKIAWRAQKKPDVQLEEKCPNCGSNVVLKTGRFGEFTACGNYPTCKHVKQKTIGMKCPECSEGEVVERRSKRGKTFYGCHRVEPSATAS